MSAIVYNREHLVNVLRPSFAWSSPNQSLIMNTSPAKSTHRDAPIQRLINLHVPINKTRTRLRGLSRSGLIKNRSISARLIIHAERIGNSRTITHLSIINRLSMTCIKLSRLAAIGRPVIFDVRTVFDVSIVISPDERVCVQTDAHILIQSVSEIEALHN